MPRLLVLTLAVILLATPTAADEDVKKRTADLVKKMKDRDATVRLAAVRDATAIQRPELTSQFVKLVKDEDGLVRLAAIEALRGRGERTCKRKAAQALAARLPTLSVKSGYWDEYVLAIAVLHDLAQPESIDALMDMGLGEDPETAKARLFAVANVPDPEAVDELIKFLSKGRSKGRNNQRDLARQALRYATGEKLGKDPDQWRSWWKKVRKDFDFEEAAARRAEARAEEERKKAERAEKERRKREKAEGKGKEKRERKRKKKEDGED
jgi:hypothetical protein